MEPTKRKHDVEPKSGDAGTPSLWYFNPSTLKNQSIDITKNEFLIGRTAEVDFQVTAQRVSRTHCLIRNVGTRDAPKWELVDKDSTLGTFLNGIKVPVNQPAPLIDGDIIYLSGPDVYPIRFVTNSIKPAKVSKPDPSFSADNEVILIQDYKLDKGSGDKLEQVVIDLTALEQKDNQIRNKPSIGLFEDTSAKSCDNIINNSCSKTKLITNNNADKENSSNEEYKLMLSILNQKLQEQEKEYERLKSELKKKDEEIERISKDKERISKDKEILKFIEDSNNELIKTLNNELNAKKRELETYQQSNSEEAVVMKTSRMFFELIESELQCSICNEVIVTSSITIPCFHVFCNACISLWFNQKEECAVCRTPSRMRVPCKILDSFIEKLIELVPDQEYKQKRRQICEERRVQQQNVVPARGAPRGGPQPQAHHPPMNNIMDAAQQILYFGMDEIPMLPTDLPPIMMPLIDLTVHDIAAANANAAAAGARAAFAAARARRPRTRRGHRTT